MASTSSKAKRPILKLGNGIPITSYIAKESLSMGVFPEEFRKYDSHNPSISHKETRFKISA